MAQNAETKRPRVAKRTVDEQEESVAFTFSNGKILVAKLADMAALQVRLALHGISQKIGDSFADAKGDVAVAYAAASDTLAQLTAGTWSDRGTADEEAPNLICTAIAVTFGRDLAKVQSVWAGLDDTKKKAFRSDERVKAEMARIRAERAAAKAAKAAPATVDASLFD